MCMQDITQIRLLIALPWRVLSSLLSRAPTVTKALPPSQNDTPQCVLSSIRLPWCAELMAVVEQTEAEKEVTSLFAAYLPSLAASAPGNKRQVPQARRDPPKHRRPEYKGKHGTQDKGKGKGNRGPTTSGPGSSSNQPPVPNMNDEEGVKEILRMLMQVSIRHEDHINLLRLDRSFLLWMKTSSPESMLPNIVAASKAWKEKREKGETDTSLRVTLLRCMLVELKNRASRMVENPESKAKLVAAGWLQVTEGREPMWNPMMWNRTEAKEVLVPDLGPLAQSDALNQIDKLLEGMDSVTLQRFHSTKPLADEYRSEMACFLLEISNRGTMATRLHQAMSSLCQSSVMFLIGARLRRETQKRSPMIDRMSKVLYSLSFT